ncbi:hypothetical protein HDU80_002406 [Chytriomyces hyalinus]|nr:hypothetical protein HDU80_002406 [Chytriomyces hyalinus]
MPPKKVHLSTPPDQQSALSTTRIPATIPAAMIIPTAMAVPSSAPLTTATAAPIAPAATGAVAPAATGADRMVPVTSHSGIQLMQSYSLPVMPAHPEIQPAVQQKEPNLKSRVAWDKDGVPPANRSSMSILIEWLGDYENYKRWKGSGGTGGTGIKRETLCSEVVQLMRAAGIHHRDNNKVGTKIRELEASYKNAIDWLSGTGQGIMDSTEMSQDEKQSDIRSTTLKKCPYFDVLDPLMSDRASSQPFATNEDGVYLPFQVGTAVPPEQQSVDANDSDDEFRIPEMPPFSAGPSSPSSTTSVTFSGTAPTSTLAPATATTAPALAALATAALATAALATAAPATTTTVPAAAAQATATPAPATPTSTPSAAALSAAKRKKTTIEMFESAYERSHEMECRRMKLEEERIIAEQERFDARLKMEQERFDFEKKRLEAAAEDAIAEAILKKVAAAEKRFAARQRFIDAGMTAEDADKMFQ